MTKIHDNFITGSIVALVTPFDDRGAGVDLRAWRALLDWHLDAGTDAVVVAGTTGGDLVSKFEADEYGNKIKDTIGGKDGSTTHDGEVIT
ncbi:MAG: dihydrodipicolinate synthase family protein, partial [Wenzhouxiangellaceae bacterium]